MLLRAREGGAAHFLYMCVKLLVTYNKTFFFFLEPMEAGISLSGGDRRRAHRQWRGEFKIVRILGARRASWRKGFSLHLGADEAAPVGKGADGVGF